MCVRKCTVLKGVSNCVPVPPPQSCAQHALAVRVVNGQQGRRAGKLLSLTLHDEAGWKRGHKLRDEEPRAAPIWCIAYSEPC